MPFSHGHPSHLNIPPSLAMYILFHKCPRKHIYEVNVLRASCVDCQVELDLNSAVEIPSPLDQESVARPRLGVGLTSQLSFYFLGF